MVPIFALFIPIVAVGGFFAWMISLSPVGKAYAERLKARTAAEGGGSEEVLQAVEDLRHEVSELAERVDFAERLLAKHQEVARLGPPK